MKNGLRVADCDMHIFEPPDLWQRYIDPAYRHAAPVGLTEMRRDMRVKVKSHIILRMGAVKPVDPSSKGLTKPAQVLTKPAPILSTPAPDDDDAYADSSGPDDDL